MRIYRGPERLQQSPCDLDGLGVKRAAVTGCNKHPALRRRSEVGVTTNDCVSYVQGARRMAFSDDWHGWRRGLDRIIVGRLARAAENDLTFEPKFAPPHTGCLGANVNAA